MSPALPSVARTPMPMSVVTLKFQAGRVSYLLRIVPLPLSIIQTRCGS
jgi:hypothetical protein